MALALFLVLQDVDALIEKLGHDDVAERDAACEEIRKLGSKALPKLREAASSKDHEVAARAKALIAEIDFPEPGPSVDGLAIAIKAEKEYSLAKGAVVLRARFVNTSDKEISPEGVDIKPEGHVLQLDYDALKGAHLCFLRKVRVPDPPAKATIKPGAHVEFTFAPEAWCAYLSHSECDHIRVGKGEHAAALSLVIRKSDGWKGTVKSNEARFSVVD